MDKQNVPTALHVVARPPEGSLGFDDVLHLFGVAAESFFTRALKSLDSYKTPRDYRQRAALQARAARPPHVLPSPWPEHTCVQAVLVIPVVVVSVERLVWAYHVINRDPDTGKFSEQISAFLFPNENAALQAAFAVLLSRIEVESEYLAPEGVRKHLMRTELLEQPVKEAPPRLLTRLWDLGRMLGRAVPWMMSVYIPFKLLDGRSAVSWLRAMRSTQLSQVERLLVGAQLDP